MEWIGVVLAIMSLVLAISLGNINTQLKEINKNLEDNKKVAD